MADELEAAMGVYNIFAQRSDEGFPGLPAGTADRLRRDMRLHVEHAGRVGAAMSAANCPPPGGDPQRRR